MFSQAGTDRANSQTYSWCALPVACLATRDALGHTRSVQPVILGVGSIWPGACALRREYRVRRKVGRMAEGCFGLGDIGGRGIRLFDVWLDSEYTALGNRCDLDGLHLRPFRPFIRAVRDSRHARL